MASKKKTFDCVEMKNCIQRDLKREYEARKTEFTSYVGFLNRTAGESEEISTFIRRLTNGKDYS